MRLELRPYVDWDIAFGRKRVLDNGYVQGDGVCSPDSMETLARMDRDIERWLKLAYFYEGVSD